MKDTSDDRRFDLRYQKSKRGISSGKGLIHDYDDSGYMKVVSLNTSDPDPNFFRNMF